MKLYDYFRSSAAYRVRIALNLKGMSYEQQSVHLVKDGGEQKRPAYLALNPQALVPALDIGSNVLTQSLAIIEYLEEMQPVPPLLPRETVARARVRAFALAIACDIHPINNLRVLNFLKSEFGADQAKVDAWYRHWVELGLQACEQLAQPFAGAFCFGDAPSLADVALVPQMFNARRFNCDVSACPTLVEIDKHAQELPAVADAHPMRQPDAAA